MFCWGFLNLKRLVDTVYDAISILSTPSTLDVARWLSRGCLFDSVSNSRLCGIFLGGK